MPFLRQKSSFAKSVERSPQDGNLLEVAKPEGQWVEAVLGENLRFSGLGGLLCCFNG